MELIVALVITTLSNDISDENLIIEARALFNKINKITTSRIIAGIRSEISEEVNKLEKLVLQTQNLKAQYYIYKACDLYCIVYKKPEDRLVYLEKMSAIIESGAADIPGREQALTKFKIADVLYDENKIEEAHNYIYNFYVEHPESFKDLLSGFHILIETAILLKKYDLAEGILNKEFHDIILTRQEPYCSFAHLNYAKLYLHKGDYEKAIGHCMEIKIAAGQVSNALMEAQIRLFETIYFFLTHDPEFSSQLASINEKFFLDYNIADRNPEINEVLKIVANCINAILQDKPVSIEIMEFIKQYQTGPKAIFGELLMRMASMPS